MCLGKSRDINYKNRIKTMGFMMNAIGLSLCVSLVGFFLLYNAVIFVSVFLQHTLISDIDKDVIADFIVQLRDNPLINDMSLYTYARDMRTLMYFFMEKEYLPYYRIKIICDDQ